MTKRAKKLPPLPKTVNAPGGPIRVEMVTPIYVDDKRCWGIYRDSDRLIQVDATLSGDYMWKVYYHELFHAFVIDAGLANLLSYEMHEALCDAIGTARYIERFG